MSEHAGRCTGIVNRGVTAALCALTVVAGALAQPGVANATPLFNGTYTAVLKSPAAPDQVSLWNVSSSCLIQGCLAHVIADSLTGFEMMFTGSQWNRLAYPQLGMCQGTKVPARSASQTLVPRADGSLAGSVTSTVDCDGAPVNVSQALTLTPL
ncbi:MAG: hypothetical protein QOJ80_80 [Mycobacterium sp.]|nr:hypothetical protein [Mycobacterium sp.]